MRTEKNQNSYFYTSKIVQTKPQEATNKCLE